MIFLPFLLSALLTNSPMKPHTPSETLSLPAPPTSELSAPLSPAALSKPSYRDGRAFLPITKFAIKGVESKGLNGDTKVFESEEIISPVSANEAVVSWNVAAKSTMKAEIKAKVWDGDHWSKFYLLGHWSPAGGELRTSLNGQKDADADVATDTLVTTKPIWKMVVSVTMSPDEKGEFPALKFLGVSLTDTRAKVKPRASLKKVWGKEITVTGKWQSGWPEANGWCSPTSTAMALGYWASKLNRPELDVAVPDAAKACFDKVYDGTGNWPFNTAFAGSFPGIRAYVTRLSDVSELEAWVEAGIPPVVSVSYDLLRGKKRDNDPGHLMVCVGFTKEGDMILNDPAYSPNKGEGSRRIFPRSAFIPAWHRSKNTVYLIYPENTKLPTNKDGHWE